MVWLNICSPAYVIGAVISTIFIAADAKCFLIEISEIFANIWVEFNQQKGLGMSVNMENEMSCLSQMNEEDRVVFIKILLSLARADGIVDDGEKDFIMSLAKIFEISTDRAGEIKSFRSDEEIVEESKKIKNRRVAMELVKEMCMLANSDGDLNNREVLLIGRVGQAMGLSLDKIEQISQWVIDRIVWLEEGKVIFEEV